MNKSWIDSCSVISHLLSLYRKISILRNKMHCHRPYFTDLDIVELIQAFQDFSELCFMLVFTTWLLCQGYYLILSSLECFVYRLYCFKQDIIRSTLQLKMTKRHYHWNFPGFIGSTSKRFYELCPVKKLVECTWIIT